MMRFVFIVSTVIFSASLIATLLGWVPPANVVAIAAFLGATLGCVAMAQLEK